MYLYVLPVEDLNWKLTVCAALSNQNSRTFQGRFFFQGLKITFSDISTIKFLLYFSVYIYIGG